MIYPSIRIEGAILAPDILERLEDAPGQRPADFGLNGTTRVKDEIARALAEAGYRGILELRRLHCQLDKTIRDAYCWHDLDLGHDFVDVETLPENDRIRYTISPAARKEVLRRLLELNLKRTADPKTAMQTNKK